jgi:hypothetical protein
LSLLWRAWVAASQAELGKDIKSLRLRSLALKYENAERGFQTLKGASCGGVYLLQHSSSQQLLWCFRDCACVCACVRVCVEQICKRS